MPTSRSRAVARASSRLATLAQAMSSTIPTAPSSISIHDLRLRADDVIVQRPDADAVSLFHAGCACSSAAAIWSIRACACSSVTPGFSRAIVCR